MAWRLARQNDERSLRDGRPHSTTVDSPVAAGAPPTLPTPGAAIDFDRLLAAARGDLAAFTAWLEKHLAALPPDQREAFLRELMRRWLAEWQTKDSAFAAAFRRLMEVAPETAGKLVALLPSVPLRHLMVQEFVRSWAARDPEAAERWMQTIREADDRSHALVALAEARLRREPGAALAWASERLRATDNPGIVQDLILGFAGADPSLAAQWTAGMEAGDVKNKATVTLATTWADRDAVKAGQWAASLAPGAARDDAVTVVGQVWTGNAPEEAIRWFAGQAFTSASARALGYHDFGNALAAADPDLADRWLASIEDPALADAALAGAADVFYDDDPAKAALTALKIKDPVARTTALGDVMNAWRDDDEEAANRFTAEHLEKGKK